MDSPESLERCAFLVFSVCDRFFLRRSLLRLYRFSICDRLGLEVLDILDASLSRFLPLRVIEHGVPCPYFLQFLTGNVWFCGVYLLPLWCDFNVWFNLLK